MKLRIVGCGPGSREYLTRTAEQIVNEAEVIVGSPGLLALFPEARGQKMAIDEVYDRLETVEKIYRQEKTVLLVTGDPGVHSIARLVIERLGRNNCEVIPGISSVQLAFAKAGLLWDEARVVSYHGGEGGNIREIANTKAHVAILTDDKSTPSKIAEELLEHCQPGRAVILCERLSLPGEKIQQMTLQALKDVKADSPNIVILVSTES
jgi:precorrin-6y C5,15-methyltransferase (decarboxylating) CbiE subunit